MKNQFLCSLTSLALTCLCLNFSAAAGIKPTDLQCEHLANPLGVDVETPRLSWKLQAEADARGQKQTGYQVLVASEPALLKEDRADVWDSGMVSSSQSTLVNYGGRKLVSNQDCFWKVRVLDRDGKISAWSPVARFTMGLLSPEDWKGSWLKHPTAAPEQHLWFRKELVVNQPVRRALVHVASIGYHELYVNGKKADDRVLAPALARLDQRVLYVTYDLTALLQRGTNAIALWTGPGWARYASLKTFPALRVQLNATLADGSASALASDDSWRTEISSSQNTGLVVHRNYGGESIDARRNVPGWNLVGFDDQTWAQAATTNVSVTLSAQMMPPSRILETFPAKQITPEKTTNGVSRYKAVFAKNFTGWLEIKMDGLNAGDQVTIMVADDAKTMEDFNQRSEYIASGLPGEVFRNRFNYSGGRFVTIDGLKKKPQLTDVTGFAVGTDLKRTGSFTCSKKLFNDIYEADLWTYRATTTEGYTADCPHRERLGYGEVAFATSWGITLPNYDGGAYLLKHIRDWADVQSPNGWINNTAPQVNNVYGGPMWSSAGLNVSWEHYQMFADRRALELIYPAGKRWLEFCESKTTNGLLYNYSDHWGKFLGDWAAPGQRRERGDSREAFYFNNCVFALNLDTMANMAVVLGKTDDAKSYRQRVAELKPRVHQEFFNATNNIYCGGTQVQQAFALLTGIAPEALRPKIAERIETEFAAKKYFDMGSSGLPVLMKYLVEQSGKAEIAFTAFARTNEPSYGYFLARGESTWPEYWNVNVPSRIHTCFTGVAGWFTKSLAGIRPDPAQPGFQSFLIQPVLAGDVTFAEATTESPYGTIRSRWEKRNGQVTLKTTIPPGSTATVYVPTRDTTSVTESGQPAAQAKGITPLRTEAGYAVFKVESGAYSFAAKF